MNSFLDHLRVAARSLARTPGATFAVWLSLALGIGVTTAVFSLVDGLLVDPPPYPEADRLTLVWERELSVPDQRRGPASLATYHDWQRDLDLFEQIAALMPVSFSLTDSLPYETPFARKVTGDYFELFGVQPMLGRIFGEREAREGMKVVVLSKELWERRFGADAGVIGRKVGLDSEPYEVVGIVDFVSPIEPTRVQLWVPLTPGPGQLERKQRQLAVYGRLAPGVTVEAARRELQAFAAELARREPEAMAGRSADLLPIQDVLVGDMRPALVALAAAGGFVLLIVVANVAHLLLMRTASRRRDLAVRTALGAGRRDLARLLLAEVALLAVAAAAGGSAIARAGVLLFKALVPVRFGLPRLDHVAIDGEVLAFALAVTLAVAAAVATAPLRALGRADFTSELMSGGRATAGRGPRRLRATLVVSEVALVLVLLVGTALMAVTFANLARRDVGRDPERLLMLRTSLRGPAYEKPLARADFFSRAVEAVRTVPGVAAAAANDVLFLSIARGGDRFAIAGQAPAASGSEPTAYVEVVTPGYFETLGLPLLAGRTLDERDDRQAPPVAVVNQRFVAAHLGGGPALGQRVTLDGEPASREVVGVFADARTYSDPADPVPTIFLPHTQKGSRMMTFVVRTEGEPLALAPRVQEAIAALDPLIPTYGVTTLAADRAEADWAARFGLVLLGCFAGLALLLALTGIYAVVAAGVAERRREFGVRLAFGASPRSLLASVLASGLTLAAAGVGVGLLASFAFSRLLESQLYGVEPGDPSLHALLALLATVVVALASIVPALRASRVDPVAALREE